MSIAASNGLRHVVVFAFIDERFPPRKNTKADVALLRAANLALRRNAEGYDDSFLLITTNLAGEPRQEDLDRYGIPGLSVVSIVRDWHKQTLPPHQVRATAKRIEANLEVIDEEGELFALEEWKALLSKLRADTSCVVASWLRDNHPTCIAHAGSEYENLGCYWVGVEPEGGREEAE